MNRGEVDRGIDRRRKLYYLCHLYIAEHDVNTTRKMSSLTLSPITIKRAEHK